MLSRNFISVLSLLKNIKYQVIMFSKRELTQIFLKIPDYLGVICKRFPLNLSGKHELILIKLGLENMFFSAVFHISLNSLGFYLSGMLV